MAKWNACLTQFIYLLLLILFFIFTIVKSEIIDDILDLIKIKNFDKAVSISYFFNLVNVILLFLTFYYFAEHDIYLYYFIYMIGSYCLSNIIYTFLED